MPILDVTVGPAVTDEHVAQLADLLPDSVSIAVECPEEPYDGVLKPGDVVLRFRRLGPHDSGDLDILVEVRSKWFASRADNREARCDALCRAISDAIGDLSVGVYLSLPVAAWSQSD